MGAKSTASRGTRKNGGHKWVVLWNVLIGLSESGLLRRTHVIMVAVPLVATILLYTDKIFPDVLAEHFSLCTAQGF